jgi:hypothetical protein
MLPDDRECSWVDFNTTEQLLKAVHDEIFLITFELLTESPRGGLPKNSRNLSDATKLACALLKTGDKLLLEGGRSRRSCQGTVGNPRTAEAVCPWASSAVIVRGPAWQRIRCVEGSRSIRCRRIVCRIRLNEARNPQVGELVEDFTLPDSTGTPRTLSSLLTDGSLLLIFYRGYW